MPKSKRAKVIHMSKTDKKGKELSQKLFANVREAADTYQYIFVFSVENMRNTYLKEVRSEFADSRLFFGKTKVMAKALGLTDSDEHLPNLHALTPYLAGNVGLLFTSRDPSTILSHFAAYTQTDYARAGIPATQTFTVPAGTVYSRGGELAVEDDVPLPHSLEVTVRKWGMPTRLVSGKVVLEDEYTVCTEGQVLNSNQTALLKMFGVAMAEFRVDMKAYYSAATQEVKEVEAMEE
ncbi:mRNA turnover protein-like protein 4 [Lophium mytilinum]|uniref:Ribosome assembly factor mrt4 n=1 Tax=Lophium mytilinum TaxID=390894 RepID=A0A6A6QC11_9PEZI|nr:mRNA turnover protein-like protein 4 [Lophium mytilinum]